MGTIWGVSSGSYSDYIVEALFSSKEKAQEFLDEYIKLEPEARLDEFDYDPEPPKAVQVIEVRITEKGDVVRVFGPLWRQEGSVGFQWYGLNDYSCSTRVMSWVVATSEEERAIKVVNEKRAIILANGAWNDAYATRALFAGSVATGGKEPL